MYRQSGHYNREIWYQGRLWYSSGNRYGHKYVCIEFAPGWDGYFRPYRRIEVIAK